MNFNSSNAMGLCKIYSATEDGPLCTPARVNPHDLYAADEDQISQGFGDTPRRQGRQGILIKCF
jgi:hypothetical protein